MSVFNYYFKITFLITQTNTKIGYIKIIQHSLQKSAADIYLPLENLVVIIHFNFTLKCELSQMDTLTTTILIVHINNKKANFKDSIMSTKA